MCVCVCVCVCVQKFRFVHVDLCGRRIFVYLNNVVRLGGRFFVVCMCVWSGGGGGGGGGCTPSQKTAAIHQSYLRDFIVLQ